MMVIMGVAHDNRAEGLMAGVAIGATVTVEAFVGGPISGASMNPARSIGPALVSGQLSFLWIYLVATTAGSVIATKFFALMHCSRSDDPHKVGCC
jgi:aquaporin Z